MEYLLFSCVILLSYIFGSLPSGLIVVKIVTGKDVRLIESGRTGGTNVFRAAGIWAGILTGVIDVLKSASAVWLARTVSPNMVWLHILAPLAAVIGHNYSIFLLEKTTNGFFRLRGGAGGAPTLGGAFALLPVSILFIGPVALMVLYFVGYASVATLSIGLTAIVFFLFQVWIGASPWQYIIYGLIVEVLLVIALLPNIRRLFNGTERLVGLRAKLKRRHVQGSPTTNQSS